MKVRQDTSSRLGYKDFSLANLVHTSTRLQEQHKKLWTSFSVACNSEIVPVYYSLCIFRGEVQDRVRTLNVLICTNTRRKDLTMSIWRWISKSRKSWAESTIALTFDLKIPLSFFRRTRHISSQSDLDPGCEMLAEVAQPLCYVHYTFLFLDIFRLAHLTFEFLSAADLSKPLSFCAYA